MSFENAKTLSDKEITYFESMQALIIPLYTSNIDCYVTDKRNCINYAEAIIIFSRTKNHISHHLLQVVWSSSATSCRNRQAYSLLLYCDSNRSCFAVKSTFGF